MVYIHRPKKPPQNVGQQYFIIILSKGVRIQIFSLETYKESTQSERRVRRVKRRVRRVKSLCVGKKMAMGKLAQATVPLPNIQLN